MLAGIVVTVVTVEAGIVDVVPGRVSVPMTVGPTTVSLGALIVDPSAVTVKVEILSEGDPEIVIVDAGRVRVS